MTNPKSDDLESKIEESLDLDGVTPELPEDTLNVEGYDELSPEEYADAASEYDNVEPLATHSEVEALKAQAADAKDKMMRALADSENTRRRSERMIEDSRKYAVSGFAKDMLDVADNLKRAMDAVSDDLKAHPEMEGFLIGIEGTEKGLLKAFEKNGITKIEPTDGIFDPNIHEVMFEAENTGQPAGTIIQLIDAGYMLNGRLLRPARVGVAKADPSAQPIHSIDEQV